MLPFLAGLAHGAESFDGMRFYLGDVHVHTGVSADGGSSDLVGSCSSGDCGALADLIPTAQAAGLDFLTVTEHTNGLHHAKSDEWAMVRDLVLAADDPDQGFVTILGAEVWAFTDEGQLGHRTLMLFGENTALAGVDVDDAAFDGASDHIGSCEDLWTWSASIESAFGPTLFFGHHPALSFPMPVDWTCHDDHFEPVVEIYSRHGASDLREPDYDPPWSSTAELGSVEHALDPVDGAGLRLGFVGGTDSHDTRPGAVCGHDTEHPEHLYGGGLTVVVQPEEDAFDRMAVHDAFVERRVYATSGPLLPARIVLSSGGAELGGMGEEITLPAGQDLDVRVTVPPEADAYIHGVHLVGPGALTWALTPVGEGAFEGTLAAEDVPAFVYAEVRFDGLAYEGRATCDDGGDSDDERLWLSPTWIIEGEAEPQDSGTLLDDEDAGTPPTASDDPKDPGCRCSHPVTRPGLGLLAGLWVLALRRRS